MACYNANIASEGDSSSIRQQEVDGIMALTAEKLNRMREQVRSKCDVLDNEAKVKLNDAMDIEWQEHFAYQQEQAKAHAEGILTPEAAMIVYTALGEVGNEKNGGWAIDTDLATKIIVTQLMSELLGLSIKARRAS